MPLRTRLTERLGIEVPILSAPMGSFAGGRLAAAVTNAGGLGLIGGGYGDAGWLDRAFGEAGNVRVGCGFITWSLARQPELLDRALDHAPAALMLSFGDVAPFADAIKRAGVPLICQVQSLTLARAAVDAGADIVVAQGGEAGGHAGSRATLTLVPEVADFLADAAPGTLLVAAGGIADGRGLAAALMLGADGVLIGSRLLASPEADAPDGFRAAVVAADGDSTVKTTIVDIVRGYDWPEGGGFTGRTIRTEFVAEWHGREAALADAATNPGERKRYWAAFHSGDVDNTAVFAGEAIGLVSEVKPVAAILAEIAGDAERLIATAKARFFR